LHVHNTSSPEANMQKLKREKNKGDQVSAGLPGEQTGSVRHESHNQSSVSFTGGMA